MNLPPPFQPLEVDAGAAEIQRIRTEYARRSREVPQDYYSRRQLSNFYHHTQLIRDCIDEMARANLFPLQNRSVVDIGCGAGKWLLEFAQWQAGALHGIDMDESRIGQARERLPAADLYLGDARRLPWADDSFDLVSQFVLFTSILDGAVKKQIAREMLRVAKPGGAILWFDFRFNNPWNGSVCGIGRNEIHSLFPNCEIKLRRVTLAPPLARAVVPVSWIAASLLEKIPFLRTHYLGIIRKQSE